MTDAPRSREQRRADTLALLTTPAIDVWMSTSSIDEDGTAAPYLVPLSLAWLENRVVIAVEERSRTARNLINSGRARLALGPTRDVVIIDAELERALPVQQAPAEIVEGYAGQADWDPRGDDGYLYLVLRPIRIQAWREADEIKGRTLMRDGRWL
ncbi:pyridoxamine 5'-phosphate oxidase family protein [Microlunatus elymi]|uniref:Pyridoxamine 5'-phosphate oxidase family protein n=1 Tax=Microlunatus elymi TaxID=2596828 RepID=A0A516Q4Q0_9ACTN|nr:pyridoxamine 5'-phosphate oxidase family protein [Microlunatus elymi]QDP98191.1 pyridoxamine 5'-phosphate oxidase family protein [Microlunatus elymi]